MRPSETIRLFFYLTMAALGVDLHGRVADAVTKHLALEVRAAVAAETAAAAAQAAVDLRPPGASTANPLMQIISPTTPLTLVANVPQNIPGNYCSVVIVNLSATPVYWGGPTPGTGAVNVGGGVPICTNPSMCPAPWIQLDTRAVAVISGSNINTVRYTTGGGC